MESLEATFFAWNELPDEEAGVCHVIHHAVYWCSPRHPPHSALVLTT